MRPSKLCFPPSFCHFRALALPTATVLLLSACFTGEAGNSGRTTFDETDSEAGTSTEPGTETTDPSGDGDGDPTTSGDGDGDPITSGDGDGDPTTSGDGDGDLGGDGDGDPPCVDECNPEALPGCLGNESETLCELDEEGCYAFTDSPCEDGMQCVANLGCVAPLAPSCQAIHDEDPQALDGAYMIDPDGFGGLPGFEVVCDMTTDGGGWTLIANNDQTTSFDFFNRNWAAYRDGFGMLVGGGRGWLGNARIHALTVDPTELQVRSVSNQNDYVHLYADFSVASEDDEFQLSVANTNASNDGGHFITDHDGMLFSTFDRDNDLHQGDNCGLTREAGWWYRSCFVVSFASNDLDGYGQVYWRNANGGPLFLDSVQLWIR